jgi:hypothetical protein
VAVIGAILALISTTTTIGADTMWLVALGDAIVRDGGIPIGVPFAAADSSEWANVPVLGELLFASVHGLGTLGLPALQILADAALLACLVIGARRLGARDVPTATVLAITAMGILSSLGVVRAQILSLVPFALLLLLLRSEHENPSHRIWLLVPLVGLWGNLHGGVLVGVAVAGCYLAFSRLRIQPVATVATGVGMLTVLWLTPAHVHTAKYYLGALNNEAARRGTELWATPRLDRPLDLLMVAAALVLIALALTVRRPIWEYVALAGLAIATADAARHGVWLVMFAAAPAALGLTSHVRLPVQRDPGPVARPRPVVIVAVAAAATSAIVLSSRAATFEEDGPVIAAVKASAGQQVVLAPEPLAEALAASGVRVWMSNPIDAFSTRDQAAYLDFLAGDGSAADRAFTASDVVVVRADSGSAFLAREAGFAVSQTVAGYHLMRRP